MDDEPSGLMTKSASAYAHLKKLAIRGDLRPNRRLSPTDLATHFQISVTPVRDALVRLAAEGFVRAEASRGYFTKPWAVSEQRDLQQVLVIHFVASLETSNEDALRQIRLGLSALADLGEEGAKGADGYVARLEALFDATALAAGNAAIAAIVRNALERTHLVRCIDLEAVGRREAMSGRVQGVADAIWSGGLPSAIMISRALRLEVDGRLAEAVGEANQRAAGLKFP